MIDEMTANLESKQVDVVLGIESKGFIMGSEIAYKLGAAFIPLKKSHKPLTTLQVDYDLEYGLTHMRIHRDALDGFKNILIIDDLLATGGTILQAIQLIKRFDNKNIVGVEFFICLPRFGGSKLLDKARIKHDSLVIL